MESFLFRKLCQLFASSILYKIQREKEERQRNTQNIENDLFLCSVKFKS